MTPTIQRGRQRRELFARAKLEIDRVVASTLTLLSERIAGDAVEGPPTDPL